ncbi:MAG: hypothetical protein HQL44_15805 [Alphaproteobacteria bacterium]|nr:hypothetical protein [Alphaproteobacteria bacterium]
MANSVERTSSQASSGASQLGSRTSLTVESTGARRKVGAKTQAPPTEFRFRNLGLEGEKPNNMDVPRGHYLDILV